MDPMTRLQLIAVAFSAALAVSLSIAGVVVAFLLTQHGSKDVTIVTNVGIIALTMVWCTLIVVCWAD